MPAANSKVTDERLQTNLVSTFAIGVEARDESQIILSLQNRCARAEDASSGIPIRVALKYCGPSKCTLLSFLSFLYLQSPLPSLHPQSAAILLTTDLYSLTSDSRFAIALLSEFKPSQDVSSLYNPERRALSLLFNTSLSCCKLSSMARLC